MTRIDRRHFARQAAGLALGPFVGAGLLGAPVAAQTGLTPAVALTPRHFPKHGAADVQEMFALGRDVGSAAVFIYQWGQPDFLEVAGKMVSACRTAGLTPVIGLSPTSLAGGRRTFDLPPSLRGRRGASTFADKPVYESFIRDALALAKLAPPYLCLATEINLLAAGDLKQFLLFAHVYKRLYAEVKKVARDTKVFVSLQWDLIAEMHRRDPGKAAEHRKQIDVFRPELDVVAFTTYPAGPFRAPDKVPADYYARIRDYVGERDEVMLMEIGWPSRGEGQTPEAQRAFVERLPSLLKAARPGIVAWSLLHDVSIPEFGADLGTTGLITTAGERKPAFDAFARLGRR